MKKLICLILTVCLTCTCLLCSALSEAQAWTRQGYFQDENGNTLLVDLSETEGYEGWSVSLTLEEETLGWILKQEGSTLKGNLRGWDETAEPFMVTVSEEGDDDLKLETEDGREYHFKAYELPEISFTVTLLTEGWGEIAYTEGENRPEFDPDYPVQSAYIGLTEPAVYTFAALPHAGNLFEKWTKNGEDYSTEPQITVLVDESAEYTAVFSEDPDWNNPVMSYMGEYQSDRANAVVECFSYDEAWITIDWASSASEVTRWIIDGRLDTETMTVTYENGSKVNLVYDEEGNIVNEEYEYTDGTGVITFLSVKMFTWTDHQSESGEVMPFKRVGYIHDPRVNPKAMEDIVENPDAVYGFSPDPASKRLGAYAEFDWTDLEFVAGAREIRIAYHKTMKSLTDIIYRMREEGASTEEMARAVSEERNRLRLASYENDPDGMAAVRKSNLETYGHEEGPTPDELFEKYGSWATVLQKAFSTHMGMDACCGLYDEFYWLYVELGLATD